MAIGTPLEMESEKIGKNICKIREWSIKEGSKHWPFNAMESTNPEVSFSFCWGDEDGTPEMGIKSNIIYIYIHIYIYICFYDWENTSDITDCW